MINNQFARRNLSNYVRGGLGLRLEEFFRLKAADNKIIAGKYGAELTNSKLGNNRELQISAKPVINKIDTREEISKVAGISHDSISKIKEIKSATPGEVLSDLERKLITGEISINQAHKFVRSVNGNGEIAKRVLDEFNKNTSGSLENKTKEIIREVQKEERDKAIKEAEEKKRLILEELRKERDEKERIERERLRKEREEKELLEKERIEKERLVREKAKKEREEQERLAREKYEKEKAEKERVRKEQQEKERIEREKKEAEIKEQQRVAKEKLEAERVEREKKEAEHKEQQRIAREKLEPIKGRSRTSRETIIAHGHI